MPRYNESPYSALPVSVHSEECVICFEHFPSANAMRRHVNKHIKLHSGRWHCPLGCGIHASQKSTVAIHLATHTGIKHLHCPDCFYATADPSSLLRHRKRRHGYVTSLRNPGSSSNSSSGSSTSPIIPLNSFVFDDMWSSSVSNSSSATESSDSDMFDGELAAVPAEFLSEFQVRAQTPGPTTSSTSCITFPKAEPIDDMLQFQFLGSHQTQYQPAQARSLFDCVDMGHSFPSFSEYPTWMFDQAAMDMSYQQSSHAAMHSQENFVGMRLGHYQEQSYDCSPSLAVPADNQPDNMVCWQTFQAQPLNVQTPFAHFGLQEPCYEVPQIWNWPVDPSYTAPISAPVDSCLVNWTMQQGIY